MIITCEWRDGKYPTFNVALASKAGVDPFITIKDCRIVDGSKGRFVSWPAKKLDSGKYFSYCFASEAFQAAVLAEAEKSKPSAKATSNAVDPDDIPF